MHRNHAGSEESQQKRLERETEPPHTPPPHRTSTGKKMDVQDAQYDCAHPLDWSPQTPDIPLVNLKAVSARTLVDPISECVMVDKEACHDKNSQEPTVRVSVEDGTDLGTEPQNTSGCQSAGHSSHARSLFAPGLEIFHSIHVDPQRNVAGAGWRRQPYIKKTRNITTSTHIRGGSTRKNVTAAGTLNNLSNRSPPPLRGVLFPSAACEDVTTASLMTLVASYCDLSTVVHLMRVSRTMYGIVTSDDVWKSILSDMNLIPLLSAYERRGNYYNFFMQDVITTRALHGHYTFQAASTVSGSRGSMSTTSGTRPATLNFDISPWEESLPEDIFNIASLQLLISAASLGQSNHPIGRAQLLLTYKNESMEVLQGSCRFSIHRRCFSLCCNAFGTVKRGPVFTVAVATVTKPWANECFGHFSGHKNGLRLVMTPVLWEGQSPGSQITENDILVVSRPKPEPLSTT